MSTGPFAAFVLSTGRCGTQWLAEFLGDVYADRLHVEHEPLHDGYQAREALARHKHGDGLVSVPPPVVVDHVRGIAARLDERPNSRSYVECGHPSWSTIPYLAERFDGRVRVIHLTRHPVPTCLSWLTQWAYITPLLPHMREKVLLSPFDVGTRFVEYRDAWESLSPFEKCLYYWSEVNAFALVQEQEMGVPWLRLQYEELFDGEGLTRLLEFLGLHIQPESVERMSTVVDKHRYSLGAQQDWRVIGNHPRAMTIAATLGYDMTAIDDDDLHRRYLT